MFPTEHLFAIIKRVRPVSKLYLRRIKVKTDLQGSPLFFYWRNNKQRVIYFKLMKNTRFFQDWWLDPEPARYRCLTDQGLICDLIYDRKIWTLEKIWD